MATKIPSWDETTEIPSWDQTKPIEAKAPKPAPRDQVTFLGSEGLGKIMADVFPRVARGTVEGKGTGSQAAAGLLDALSYPGRSLAGSGEVPKGRTWRDGNPEVGKIKGEGFVESTLRDPATAAALLTAPFTAGASIPAIMGAGAAGGAASAAAHQTERALEGRGVSIPQSAGEIALSTLLPVAAYGGGKVMQSGGKKILNTILKPKQGVQEQVAKTGEKTIADLIFKHDLDSPIPFRGGVEGIQNRNNALRGKMNEEFGKILDDADRVVTLTSKAPPAASATPKAGIDVTGGVEPGPIYAGSGIKPIEGGNLQIPESTVPGPEDVIRAGMNKPPLLTDGKPGIIITPAPRPAANPPAVVITPNPVQMPNRIDPRFARPTATPTPNQPPIPRLNPGESHGIPSDRNLPALAGGRGLSEIPPEPRIPLSGADPIGAEDARILGLPPGAAPEPPAGGFASTGPAGAEQMRLPPGTPETVTDLTKRIDLQKALDDAFGQLQGEFSAQGKHAGVLPGIDQGRDYWQGALARKTEDGQVPIRFSQGFKQEAGDAGNFLATDPGDVKGKARYANALYRAIRDQQNDLMPDLIPINKTLSETHPIKDALEDAIPRLEKNNLITPSDLWTLGPSMMGGGLGLAASNPAAATMAFAAPLLANRLSKNPTFASQIYRLGESMVDPGVVATPRKRAIERALATGLFSENQ